MPRLLSKNALSDVLSVTDLTDACQERHAMQLLIQEIRVALVKEWKCKQQLVRTSPVVPLANNYDLWATHQRGLLEIPGM